jgi:hypothetical protein
MRRGFARKAPALSAHLVATNESERQQDTEEGGGEGGSERKRG